MSDEPLVPTGLSTGAVVDRGLRLFRSQVWRLLAGAAILIVPVSVLGALVLGQTMTGLFGLAQATPTRRGGAEAFEGVVAVLGTMAAFTLIALLAALAQAMASLIVTVLADAGLRRRAGSLASATRVALRRLFYLIVMYFLQGVCMAVVYYGGAMVMYFFMLLVLAAAGLLGVAQSSSQLAGVLIVVGMVLVFLVSVVVIYAPMAYLYVRWRVAPIVLVVENHGPVASLGRAWRLSRHNFWRTFLVIVAAWLLAIAFATSPAALLLIAGSVLFGQQQPGWIVGLFQGVFQLTTIVSLTMETCVAVVLYYDLRARGEGLDLELKIAALERTVAALPRTEAPSPASAPSAPPLGAPGLADAS